MQLKTVVEKPIVNESFILQKGPEKGAWTFLELPFIDNLPKSRNGTVRIRGFIDDFELREYNMWAIKKGNFIAVKSDIRKQIKKEAGDAVKVVLYLDELPSVIPDDFLICLKEEPEAYAKFQKLPEAKKSEITDWIFCAKTEDAKVERIAAAIDKILLGK